MISVGILHLPHVVEERRELRHPLLVGVEPEPLRDGEDELDDVAAVRARVRVVRLDHVAEQVRRPWYAFFSSSTLSFFSSRSRPMRATISTIGMSSSRAAGWRYAGKAARRPSGASTRSNAVGEAALRRCAAQRDAATTAPRQRERRGEVEDELRARAPRHRRARRCQRGARAPAR